MEKPIKNILCYSHEKFDEIMRSNGWLEHPGQNCSVISICSPNEADLAEHWFDDDCHTTENSVFNLDIDDVHPFWFENHEEECYEKAFELNKDGLIKQSNRYFSHLYISGKNNEFVDIVHALDYEEANDLVYWIHERIHNFSSTFYIHCAVGASRSQAVVRYIIDTYGSEFEIRTNPNNPNNSYNPHVLRMMKDAYVLLFGMPREDYYETAPMKFNSSIKLNLL